jgi:hypothetical protein
MAREGPAAFDSLEQRWEAGGRPMWEYAPSEFSRPIIQFLAADQPVSTRVLDDPRLGWREFAAGGFEVRKVAGDHNSILSDEGLARRLADDIRDALRQRQMNPPERPAYRFSHT